MATAVQLLLKQKSAPLKVRKAPLFELDGALLRTKRRSARVAPPFPPFFHESGTAATVIGRFHSDISFSSPAFVHGESNAANQRDDNIFHQLGDPGQEPSSSGKNQGPVIHPVTPHLCSRIQSIQTCPLLTLIIHKQHKGWNRAGCSLFMAPKCVFSPLKMCPKLFTLCCSPRSGRLSFSLE